MVLRRATRRAIRKTTTRREVQLLAPGWRADGMVAPRQDGRTSTRDTASHRAHPDKIGLPRGATSSRSSRSSPPAFARGPDETPSSSLGSAAPTPDARASARARAGVRHRREARGFSFFPRGVEKRFHRLPPTMTLARAALRDGGGRGRRLIGEHVTRSLRRRDRRRTPRRSDKFATRSRPVRGSRAAGAAPRRHAGVERAHLARDCSRASCRTSSTPARSRTSRAASPRRPSWRPWARA